MPTHSAESALALVLIAILGAVSLAGCDGAGPEEENAEPVRLNLTQRDSLDRTVAELGTYTVSLVDQPVPQGAMREEVILDGHRGGMSYGRFGGNPDKEVVVFLLTFDGRTGTVRYDGGAFKPGVRSEPVEGIPTGEDGVDMFRGTLYGFFVDDIGDRPEVPVEIVLEGSEDTRKLVVDPEKHTLSARYALRLSQEDVPLAAEKQTQLQVRLDAAESDDPELWSSTPPYPSYILETSVSVGAGRAIPGSSTSVPLGKGEESFDFYMLLLDE